LLVDAYAGTLCNVGFACQVPWLQIDGGFAEVLLAEASEAASA
jgi:hypothetical protein